MAGELYRCTPRTNKQNSTWFDKSRILLTCGCVLCCLAMALGILALFLPYWIYVTGTMETTVAGLTDSTEVTYFYGLLRYCLKMTATHLNRDECGEKNQLSWERITMMTLTSGLGLQVVTMVMILLNFLCWNNLFLLISGTVAMVTSAVCTSVGVSLYQINASTLTIDIGGLTTAIFQPTYLYIGFWTGFASAVVAILASFLFLFGTFAWEKPKEHRLIHGGKYRTTVGPVKCPYKGRQPAIISITQM